MGISYDDPGIFERIDELMTRIGPGLYEATVSVEKPLPFPTIARSFRYHLFGIMPRRSVNGTQGDGYWYDGDGDYFSTINVPEGADSITVRFDHALLPQPTAATPHAYEDSVWGAPQRNPVIQLAADIDSMRAGSTKRFRRMMTLPRFKRDELPEEPRVVTIDPGTGMVLVADSAFLAYEDSIDQTNEETREQLLKSTDTLSGFALQSAWIRYLSNLMLFAPYEERVDADGRISQALNVIPPDSPLWSLTETYRLSIMDARKDSLNYLLRMIRTHPSDKVAADASALLLGHLRRPIDTLSSEGDAVADMQLLYDSLRTAAMERFAGTQYEENIIFKADGVQAYRRNKIETMKSHKEETEKYMDRVLPEDTLAGKPVPGFRFPALFDSSRTVSAEDFRGAPFLYLEYAPGCGTAETVDVFRELLRMYSDRGLRVLEVVHTLSADHARELLAWERSGDSVMTGASGAWVTAYRQLPDSGQAPMLFETVDNTAMLLVDSEGITRASNGYLFWEYAFVSLDRFFKNPRED